jgi:hypothetical protein
VGRISMRRVGQRRILRRSREDAVEDVASGERMQNTTASVVSGTVHVTGG